MMCAFGFTGGSGQSDVRCLSAAHVLVFGCCSRCRHLSPRRIYCFAAEWHSHRCVGAKRCSRWRLWHFHRRIEFADVFRNQLTLRLLINSYDPRRAATASALSAARFVRKSRRNSPRSEFVDADSQAMESGYW